MNQALAAAFLQAIRDNPEDDAPRLIYADWLEEHGDPERAEFIRVQCEQARLPWWHPRAQLLACRAEVLLCHHEERWRSELPDIAGVTWLSFDRGFVHEVGVGDVDFLSKKGAEIVAAAPIRWASIGKSWGVWGKEHSPASYLRGVWFLPSEDIYYGLEVVLYSRLFTTVEMLDLSALSQCGPLEAEYVMALGNSPYLGNLRALILDGFSLGDGRLRPLLEGKQLANLTTLSLQGGGGSDFEEPVPIGPTDVALLANSPTLANLTSLDLSGNAVDAESLSGLLSSPHMANLRELVVAGNRLTAETIGPLARVGPGPRLRSLSLAWNPIGDRGAQVLATADFCEVLQNLDLDTCKITAHGVQALAKAPWMAHLCRLDLDHNSAGADGIRALLRALNSGELGALHLRDNDLGYEALDLLVESPSLRGLLFLDLGQNGFGNDGVEALVGAAHLGQLRKLRLDSCNIDAEGARRLRQAPWLPGLVRLVLSNNPLRAEGLGALLQDSGLDGINELGLGSCQLAHKEIETLASSPPRELHWLDLSNNMLGPAGAEALAGSPLAAMVQELLLDRIDLQDGGAAALAAGSWPRLRFLSLRDNQLSDAGARALAKSGNLANVAILHPRLGWPLNDP
jgi:uncharacterized protein (TIGR02996 family)